MKKFILYFVLMLSGQVAMAGTTTTPAYAIWNVDTGHMLAGKNSDGVRSMASITKLMTVLVTLRSGVKLDESVVIVGQESSSRIRRGMNLTRRELIDLALVASDNLASRTLAETSGMPYEEFIWTMNRTASTLGMTDTYYSDSTGLLASNVTTASDLKLLVQETERWRVFHDTAMAPTSTIAVWVKNRVRQITFNNTNHFAGQLDIIGAKTGTTQAAGRCLTMFFVENGQRYVLVVLGAHSSAQRQKMVTKLIDIIR